MSFSVERFLPKGKGEFFCCGEGGLFCLQVCFGSDWDLRPWLPNSRIRPSSRLPLLLWSSLPTLLCPLPPLGFRLIRFRDRCPSHGPSERLCSLSMGVGVSFRVFCVRGVHALLYRLMRGACFSASLSLRMFLSCRSGGEATDGLFRCPFLSFVVPGVYGRGSVRFS